MNRLAQQRQPVFIFSSSLKHPIVLPFILIKKMSKQKYKATEL